MTGRKMIIRTERQGFTMPALPYMGMLGFVFGCCLTVIITLLFIPANEFWPSTYEDRRYYLRELTKTHNFSYRPELYIFNNSRPNGGNKTFETEGEYLTERARMLCYSIEQEADDETHASLIMKTWATHCDKTIMFYTSPRLLDKIKRSYLEASLVLQLVYVDPSNSTIGTLVKVLNKYIDIYKWFVYVPPKVFLLPNNMKYFLIASKINPESVAFSGKPDIGKLFDSWSVSERSPLAITAGAIKNLTGLGYTPSCYTSSIQDPGCLIDATKSRMLDMRDVTGTRVITWLEYSNFWIRYGNVNVKDKVKTRFPVSVYIQGSYKNLMDLEYYLHHLKAYGHRSVDGSYTKET